MKPTSLRHMSGFKRRFAHQFRCTSSECWKCGKKVEWSGVECYSLKLPLDGQSVCKKSESLMFYLHGKQTTEIVCILENRQFSNRPGIILPYSVFAKLKYTFAYPCRLLPALAPDACRIRRSFDPRIPHSSPYLLLPPRDTQNSLSSLTKSTLPHTSLISLGAPCCYTRAYVQGATYIRRHIIIIMYISIHLNCLHIRVRITLWVWIRKF